MEEPFQVEPYRSKRFLVVAFFISLLGEAASILLMTQGPVSAGQLIWDSIVLPYPALNALLRSIVVSFLVLYLASSVLVIVPAYRNWGPKAAIAASIVYLPASIVVLVLAVIVLVYNRHTGRSHTVPGWLKLLQRARTAVWNGLVGVRSQQGSGPSGSREGTAARSPATRMQGLAETEKEDAGRSVEILCPACYELFPAVYSGRKTKLVCPHCGRQGTVGGHSVPLR